MQSMFLVGGCGPNFLTASKNVIKGVACVQTSITLRIAIEISCLQKVVHANKKLCTLT